MNRLRIIKVAKSRIDVEHKNYNKYDSGQREVIQDQYIEQVCLENNTTLSEFYNYNGKKLNNLIENNF